MDLAEADARRRDGLTSWAEYGREASAAADPPRLGRLVARRDGRGRLKRLNALGLADLSAALHPVVVGELEHILLEEVWGKSSPEETRARMIDVLRTGHPGEMVAAFQESIHSQLGIGPAGRGYPLLDRFLRALSAQGRITLPDGESVGPEVVEETLVDVLGRIRF